MAKPSTRQGLIDYALRKLGAPVLEINIDDDQIDDLVDDALQLFNERCFDGVERMYLKYRFTQNDIDRGKAHNQDGSDNTVGLTTTTGTSTITAKISTAAAKCSRDKYLYLCCKRSRYLCIMYLCRLESTCLLLSTYNLLHTIYVKCTSNTWMVCHMVAK